MTAEEILQTKKSYAIIGASNEMLKYGYELVVTLNDAGYNIFPINPKYEEIEGVKCYPSLKELPEKPEVIIIALAPHNTERVIKEINNSIGIYWLPPNCYNGNTINFCKENKYDFVYNVCPIGTLNNMSKNDLI